MMTREELEALANSTESRVEVDAETFLTLAKRAKPRSLLDNYARSFPDRKKPVRVSPATVRELIALMDAAGG